MVRIGLLALVAGILVLIAGLEVGADSSIVFIPLLIIGLGIGALASQLGAVTVSAVPEEKSSEVGGLQNTATQLGASLGTALVGSVLLAALTTSFLAGIEENPDVPQSLKDQANVSWPPAPRSSPTPSSRRTWPRPASPTTSPRRSSTRTRLAGRRPAFGAGDTGRDRSDRPVLHGAHPQGAGGCTGGGLLAAAARGQM